jgi:hypothetical protein
MARSRLGFKPNPTRRLQRGTRGCFQQRFQQAGDARDRFYELARRQIQVADLSVIETRRQPVSGSEDAWP